MSEKYERVDEDEIEDVVDVEEADDGIEVVEDEYEPYRDTEVSIICKPIYQFTPIEKKLNAIHRLNRIKLQLKILYQKKELYEKYHLKNKLREVRRQIRKLRKELQKTRLTIYLNCEKRKIVSRKNPCWTCPLEKECLKIMRKRRFGGKC